jgi:hypothetical protein
LAALSGTDEIKVANEGDLTISSFTNNLGLSGIELSGQAADDKNVEVVTTGAITVDAPVTNGTVGKIILVAQGASSTDDVTINSTITGDDVKVYAGDSITLSDSASLQVKDAGNNYGYSSLQVIDDTATQGYGTTQLFYGINYNSSTSASSAGYASASVVISDYSTLESIVNVTEYSTLKLIIHGPTRRLLYVSPEQNDDYFNALNPSAEVAEQLNITSFGNVLISNDLEGLSLGGAEEGSIVIEEPVEDSEEEPEEE